MQSEYLYLFLFSIIIFSFVSLFFSLLPFEKYGSISLILNCTLPSNQLTEQRVGITSLPDRALGDCEMRISGLYISALSWISKDHWSFQEYFSKFKNNPI